MKLILTILFTLLAFSMAFKIRRKLDTGDSACLDAATAVYQNCISEAGSDMIARLACSNALRQAFENCNASYDSALPPFN